MSGPLCFESCCFVPVSGLAAIGPGPGAAGTEHEEPDPNCEVSMNQSNSSEVSPCLCPGSSPRTLSTLEAQPGLGPWHGAARTLEAEDPLPSFPVEKRLVQLIY